MQGENEACIDRSCATDIRLHMSILFILAWGLLTCKRTRFSLWERRPLCAVVVWHSLLGLRAVVYLSLRIFQFPKEQIWLSSYNSEVHLSCIQGFIRLQGLHFLQTSTIVAMIQTSQAPLHPNH
jgi:hypothetical protein